MFTFFCPAGPAEGLIKPEVKEEQMGAYRYFDTSPVDWFSEVSIVSASHFEAQAPF